MEVKLKKRRFFFHFRKSTGELTLHWNKQCIQVKDIVCNVPLETKWNKQQPRVVLRGFASDIQITNGKALIL
jgi:hypothetical protein